MINFSKYNDKVVKQFGKNECDKTVVKRFAAEIQLFLLFFSLFFTKLVFRVLFC